MLLTRVLERAASVVDGRIVVVLGRASKQARYALERWVETTPGVDSRVKTVLNHNYRYGQSTSLKAGIRLLPGASGALVLLADMPAIEPTRLEQLRDAVKAKNPQVLAVAASAQGQIRPPVYLSATLFKEVGRLKGDQGAKVILNAYQAQVSLLEWGDGLWCSDIDDWPAYRYLANRMGWVKEPFAVIPRTIASTEQIKAVVDAALERDVVPWLAPGLLMIPGRGETQCLELSAPYRGVWGLVKGGSSNPAQYLQLLRRATLSAMSWGF